MITTHFIPALVLVLTMTLIAATRGQSMPTTGPGVAVAVDPRVELMCIVFRLAGNREYNQTKLTGYAKDIDDHFGRFREHPAVQYARRMGRTRGIGYDAPMSLAVNLSDIRRLDLQTTLDPWPAGLDGRWNRQSIEEFVPLLRQFVEDGRFTEFIDAHAEFYGESTARMRRMLDRNLKLEWFDGFFGPKQAVEFRLLLGLCNGTGNYGVRTGAAGDERLYAIIGAWSADADGLPRYSAAVLPTIIHEFCHSYCNPLVDTHYNELASAGDKLFAGKEALMRQQAYSSGRTVLYETLVRACVVRYRFDNNGAAAGMSEVLEQRLRGFDWVGELATALADYESHRDQYPTPNEFMPRVAECLNRYVAK